MQYSRRLAGRISFPQAVFQRLIAVFLAGLILLPTVLFSADIIVVKADRLNLRRQPSTRSARLAVLKKNTRVAVLGYRGGWVKVLYNKKIGYLRNKKEYLTIIKGTKAGIKKQSSQIDRQIETTKATLSKLKIKESNLLESLNSMDYAINSSRKKINLLKKNLRAVKAELANTKKEFEKVKSRYEKKLGYMEKRLVSLYKLTMLGKISLLLSSESMYEMVNKEYALEKILKRDKELILDLNEEKKILSELTRRMEEKKRSMESLIIGAETEKRRLAEEKRRRSRLLARIRKEKRLEEQTLNELKAAAEALNEAIRRLKHAEVKQEAAKTGTAFSDHKGLLIMPVKGKITAEFGRYRDLRYKIVKIRTGISIEADRGEPIHAVFGGVVVFSSWFKGYGNMVILHHGGGYYTVYAHAEELFKKKGDHVDAGEVIATVGESGSMTGPQLYFEIRHRSRPLNPLDWIKTG